MDKIKLIKYGIKAEGEIIDFKKGMSSYINEDKQIVYITVSRPVIRFVDENNEIRIITYDISENDRSYKIGIRLWWLIQEMTLNMWSLQKNKLLFLCYVN
ncbi:hypothetical protein [Clostridium butyricum]